MRDASQTIYEKRICPDCGEPFTLTAREIDWYAARGMQIPRRCSVCRQARREAGQGVSAGRSESR